MYGINVTMTENCGPYDRPKQFHNILFSKSIDSIIEYWCKETQTEKTDYLVKAIKEDKFWNTTYYRKDGTYKVKIFEVKNDEEINL